MAEKRMLSRRASKSKKLAAVSYQTEALYYRAIPFLDDAGRVTADPEDFRAEILPLGKRGKAVPLAQVEAAIQEMYGMGLVGLCSCEKTRCMEYANFLDFQTLQKDRKPKIGCLEPVGIQWNQLDPMFSNGIPNRREEKRSKEKGRGEPPPQIGCLEPVGIQWNQLDPMFSNGIPNGREGKLIERKGRGEPPPPEIQELIHNVENIKGWKFTEAEDADYFARLLDSYPMDLVTRTLEDLRTYQEKPKKHYDNLHSTLRNWCKKAATWEAGEAPKPEIPTDDNGKAMERVDGKFIPKTEWEELYRAGELVATTGGWKRKEASE